MGALYGWFPQRETAAVDASTVAGRLESRLAHRAPAGWCRRRSEGQVLGQARTPGALDAAAGLPVHLDDGRVVASDGYVANRTDVARGLGLDPADASDAVLLALALQTWGDRLLAHVRGEFVLAAWDPRHRALSLHADHLGARPLRYAATADGFAFASEATALVGLPGISAELDPLVIAGMWYPAALDLDLHETSFRDVRSLPPGHVLRWSPGRAPVMERIWRLSAPPTLPIDSPEAAAQGFRDVFGQAVSEAMHGHPRAALVLSGGIDSAAILAARRGFRADGQADDLLCISATLEAGFPDGAYRDEHANIVALTRGHPHVRQFAVPPGGTGQGGLASADLAEAAWSFMHPRDASLLVPILCCGIAREAGVGLVLNGVDGDAVTAGAGNQYLSQLVGAGQLSAAWREAGRASQHHAYLRGFPRHRLFAEAVGRALLPDAVRRQRQRRRLDATVASLDRHPVLAPGLATRLSLGDRLRAAFDRRSAMPGQEARLEHLAYTLAGSLDASHHVASRFGLESRHPWCDVRVLDWCLALPQSLMVRDGWTKHPVRHACADALGASVAWHSGKAHLGALLTRPLLQDAAPYLRGLLAEQAEALAAFVRSEAVTTYINRLDHLHEATPEECDSLLMLVSLAGWLRFAHGSST